MDDLSFLWRYVAAASVVFTGCMSLRWLTQYFLSLSSFLGILFGIVLTLGVEAGIVYYIYKRFKAAFKNEKDIGAVTTKEDTDLYKQDVDPKLLEQTKDLAGFVHFQLGGKKRYRRKRYCYVLGDRLYIQKGLGTIKAVKGGIHANESVVFLKDTMIRQVEEKYYDIKHAFELMHPKRKIVYRHDYMYLSFNSDKDRNRWMHTLVSAGICTLDTGATAKAAMMKMPAGLAYDPPSVESATWLNFVISRFFKNLRDQENIVEKVANHIALRLGEKVDEKHLDGVLTNVVIVNLKFGNKPPIVGDFKIIPSSEGEMILDFTIDYRDGDASLCLEAVINLGLTTFPARIGITIEQFSAKCQLRMPQFPAERFSLSFYEAPTTKFEVTFPKGLKVMKGKITDVVESRLNTSLIERFVRPNRRYFTCPGCPKMEPPTPDTVSKTKVAVAHVANVPGVEVASLRDSSDVSEGSNSNKRWKRARKKSERALVDSERKSNWDSFQQTYGDHEDRDSSKDLLTPQRKGSSDDVVGNVEDSEEISETSKSNKKSKKRNNRKDKKRDKSDTERRTFREFLHRNRRDGPEESQSQPPHH